MLVIICYPLFVEPTEGASGYCEIRNTRIQLIRDAALLSTRLTHARRDMQYCCTPDVACNNVCKSGG